MKTMWKSILAAAAVIPVAGAAFAQNKPITCWYNDHADFTSADSAPAGATIGSVVKASSGDKTYSYTISARDGMACPVQLPLSTSTALTVALVRQDDGNCTNDNVADTGSAAVVGSVTVFPETSTTSTAAIRLAGASPNTSYRIFLKCFRQLGTHPDRRQRQRRTNRRLSNRRGWCGHRVRNFSRRGAAGHQAAEPRY